MFPLMGRPPLGENARNVSIGVRLRRGAAERFLTAAQRRGLTTADAHREALAEWTVKQEQSWTGQPRGSERPSER